MTMPATLPLKVYEILETQLGKEKAKEIINAIEASIDSATLQKKLEVKDELSKELVTKTEFFGETKVIRQEIQTIKIDIEGKLKVYFLALLFVVILVSPKAIDLIAKFLGIIK